VGQRPEKVLPHLVDRLDRDHAGAEGNERARQLARAGGKVEDVATRLEPETLGDPRHRLLGIARPTPLVRVGGSPETPRCCGVDLTQDGVTLYASKTESPFRSEFSRGRSDFTSPISAVYQFRASWSSTMPP